MKTLHRLKELAVVTGLLAKNPAKRTLKELEFYHNVEIEIIEFKGVLESDLHIIIKGKVQDVYSVCSKFFQGMERWNDMENETDDHRDEDDGVLDALSVFLLCMVAVVAIALGIVLIF